jgi:hypothetical protein
MRKNTILAAIIAGALSLNSCMNLGSGSSTGTTGGNTDLITAGAAILENLLGGLLSNSITEQNFVGTWT